MIGVSRAKDLLLSFALKGTGFSPYVLCLPHMGLQRLTGKCDTARNSESNRASYRCCIALAMKKYPAVTNPIDATAQRITRWFTFLL